MAQLDEVAATGADELVLLGDLFQAWVGFRQAIVLKPQLSRDVGLAPGAISAASTSRCAHSPMTCVRVSPSAATSAQVGSRAASPSATSTCPSRESTHSAPASTICAGAKRERNPGGAANIGSEGGGAAWDSPRL